MAVENVCRYNKFGFCKFKSNCKNKHIEELCEDKSCDKMNCDKRHPKPCKYFVNFGDCKLGSICAYAHNQSVHTAHNNMKIEIEKLEQKVDRLTMIIKNKEDIINQLVKDVKVLRNIINKIELQDVDENIDKEEITQEGIENDNECVECDKDEIVDEDVTLEEKDDETANLKTNQSSENQNNKENKTKKPWTPSSNDQLANELFELQERLRQKRLFLASL